MNLEHRFWILFDSQMVLSRNRTTCLFRNGAVFIGPRYMGSRTRYGMGEEDLFLILPSMTGSVNPHL
jgi:hypothetical protein